MIISDALDDCFAAWEGLLGNERCSRDITLLSRYQVSTLGIQKVVYGALFPQTTHEVISLVKIAGQYRIPLYPISVGNNWGYGSRTPPEQSCVIVDLSRMNKIPTFDEELGLITIQPGVTTKQLNDFLIQKNSDFAAPIIQAGPNVSVLGNTLDHGNATGNAVDRFAKIMSLEVVLADGSIYRSPFSGGDTDVRSTAFKWGIGPYLDGLFGQSNFGIVTSATIALAERPEKSEVFFARVHKNSIPQLITSIRNTTLTMGSTVPFIRIQSPRVTFSRLLPYSEKHLTEQGIIDPDYIDKELRKYSLAGWVLIGLVQGNQHLVKAARKSIRKNFHPLARTPWFLSHRSIAWLASLARIGPAFLKRRLHFLLLVRSFVRSPEMTYTTDRNPLLPHWKLGLALDRSNVSDYDTDPKSGFIFFSVVFPMTTSCTGKLIEITEQICTKYGIEPLVSFSNFSDRCFRMSLPILFDKQDETQTKKAHDCYRELFEECKKNDIHVYRAGIQAMDLVVDMHHPFWQTAEKIKKVLDPENIMSPGRYSKYKRADE